MYQLLDEIPCFITSKTVSFIAVITSTLVYLHVGYHIIRVLTDGSITHIIIKIVAKGPEIVIDLVCLTVPFYMWNRNHELQEYWKEWKNFQVRILKSTHLPNFGLFFNYYNLLIITHHSWNTKL